MHAVHPETYVPAPTVVVACEYPALQKHEAAPADDVELAGQFVQLVAVLPASE